MTDQSITRQVTLADYGNRIEAYDGLTLLGTAQRSTGRDMDWIGWLIVVAGQHEELPTKAAAKASLRAKAEWLAEQAAA